MWINARKILLGIMIIVVVSIFAYFAKKHSPNRDDTKLYEVRQLYSQLALPPDFKETGSSFQSKAEGALEEKYFSSKSKYEEVKGFVLQHLTPAGWTLVEDRSMTDWGRDLGGRQLKFRKGEYWIVIEYAGEKASDQWDYAVTVEWKKSS
ncbi:MAG TPA: hypothetical protein VEM96_10065 [Pyrinomonadaceae bacterium]|nr:hypothetical protein [Pyrinomonadaceae bacterium]